MWLVTWWPLHYLCDWDHTGSSPRPLSWACQSTEPIFMEAVPSTLQRVSMWSHLRLHCVHGIEFFITRKTFFKQIVPCLNMSETNCWGQTPEVWTYVSCVESNYLLASLGSLPFWLWWLQRPLNMFMYVWVHACTSVCMVGDMPTVGVVSQEQSALWLGDRLSHWDLRLDN